MNQNTTGWLIVALSAAVIISDLGDRIADLQNWHGAVGTAFVGPLLKEIGSVVMAALGGKMTTQFGNGGSK